MTSIQRTLRVSMLAVLAWLGACAVPSPCDPGWTHDHGTCTPPPMPIPDAGSTGDGDGDDAGSEPDAGPMEEPGLQFICPAGGDQSVYGRPCETHDDCECPASICLPAPLGYCGGTQCMEPGKECPDGHTCLDIEPYRGSSSFPVPDEVTHVCI